MIKPECGTITKQLALLNALQDDNSLDFSEFKAGADDTLNAFKV